MARELRGPRLVLLFHLAFVLDVNECEMECLQCSCDDKVEYFVTLAAVVAREAAELGGNDMFSSEELQSLFSMFHKQMRLELTSNGRREPGTALRFWKEANSNRSTLSPYLSTKLRRLLCRPKHRLQLLSVCSVT